MFREGDRCILTHRRCFSVPPAEMEALLLQHPKIADSAVIGVYSNEEVTELPRFVFLCHTQKTTPGGRFNLSSPIIQGICRSQGETTTGGRVCGVLERGAGVGPRSCGQT